MLACLDVHYAEDHVRTALLLADTWPAAEAVTEHVSASSGRAAEYVPGRFFERELPYLVAALAHAPFDALRVVVVDAHVWLDGDRPGLGAHLYEALGARVAVVGVGKQHFHDQTRARPVLRGQSRSPLYVTAAGLDVDAAAAAVRSMHGEHRLPTLLRRVDQLARGMVTAR
jgi:deoxyribonuclease V